MGGKTKWKSSYTIHEIGNQSRVVGKVGMQMVYVFSGSPFFQNKNINQVNRLKETFPAIAGGISFINLWVGCNIGQGAKISKELTPGNLQVLSYDLHPWPRLHGLIQIMNGSPNLFYLHLNNLFMRVSQGKDLNRHTDLFQSKDLVQDKGL